MELLVTPPNATSFNLVVGKLESFLLAFNLPAIFYNAGPYEGSSFVLFKGRVSKVDFDFALFQFTLKCCQKGLA